MHPTVAALRLRWQLPHEPPVADFFRLPKIGGMASIPTRAGDLGAVLAEILPQVDRLHLFLHGYEHLPEAARHPKIIPTLAPREHPYRASGKFHGLAQEVAPCLYFGLDDDILYRAGYVARLVRGLIRYRGRAVVGLHGVRYRSPEASFRTHRRSYMFERGLALDHAVDILGAGTVAFVSTQLPLNPPAWPHGDMDDLMLAMEAERRHLPRVALGRPPRSIVAVATNQPDSLWQSALRDDTRHTEQLRRLLALMGRRPAP
jgi:hypothetical protein